MEAAHESTPGTDWTAEELNILCGLARAGSTAARAANLLGRRISSVRRQARQLGLLLYKQ
jgi:hypothetical protein